MRVVAVVQPVALHGLGCLTRASMPRSTGTCRLLSRHPHAAPLLPHSGKVYPDSSALRCDTPNHLFEIVGAVGLEPTNPSLVSVVLRSCNQRLSCEEVRKFVRESTRTSVDVGGDCRSDSHSAMTLNTATALS